MESLRDHQRSTTFCHSVEILGAAGPFGLIRYYSAFLATSSRSNRHHGTEILRSSVSGA
jgi:hypothetical protein